MCPTKCLLRIKEQHEPNLGFQLGPVGEIYAQEKNKTWTYVSEDSIRKHNKHVKIIDSRWVFTKKLLPNRSTKYKGRFVI